MIDQRVPNQIVNLVILHNYIEHMRQLWYRVILFDENLLGPRGQRKVGVFHACGKRRAEYFERLSHHNLGLGRICFHQRMKHLQHDSLVDGELGNDVTEQQMTVILVKRVHTRLGKQTRPREGHEASQFGALLFIIHVMYVIVSVLYE